MPFVPKLKFGANKEFQWRGALGTAETASCHMGTAPRKQQQTSSQPAVDFYLLNFVGQQTSEKDNRISKTQWNGNNFSATCWDLFRPTWMHSDTFGYVWTTFNWTRSGAFLIL